MKLFSRKKLAKELETVEAEYVAAAQAVEVLEDAAVDGELNLDVEKEKILEQETAAAPAEEPAPAVEETPAAEEPAPSTEEPPVFEEAATVPEAQELPAEDGTAAAENKTSGRKAVEFTYELVSVLMVAAVMTAILFTFIYRFSGVVGESMEPTLHSGDWVFLSQMEDTTPQYGDVVVISQDNAFHENIIKRVIATEGQIIDINYDTGDVIVNGQILDEPYINNETINAYDMSLPIMVPEGTCFVMGDNRQNSVDSRSSAIGLIDNDYILGIAKRASTPHGLVDLELPEG